MIFEKFMPGDHPRREQVREYVRSACANFVNRGLADLKFLTELQSGEEQKFWACVSEALVALLLIEKDFGERARLGAGPDFLVMNCDKKIWIEVICPEPIRLPEEWRETKFDKAVSVPHEEILLRWMSAIKAKAEKLVGSTDGRIPGYLDSGLVAPNDAYVIAVNACRLRNGQSTELHGISGAPFAAEAVFPIGPIQIQINQHSRKVVGRGHQYRPHVINHNDSPVPADSFLDPRFAPISAIWAIDMAGGVAIGNAEPSLVVHNPKASNRIPIGFLPADAEYEAIPEGDHYLFQQCAPGASNAG